MNKFNLFNYVNFVWFQKLPARVFLLRFISIVQDRLDDRGLLIEY